MGAKVLKKKVLVLIEGPTASGKTAISIRLAKHLNAPILSSDSRQFYKELSIGTAKPSIIEQDGVPHYFIDSHHLQDQVTAASYEAEAIGLLGKLFEEHAFVILTGGSGLFTDAVCEGLDSIPKNEIIKKELIKLLKNNGLAALLEELKAKDPFYYEQVDRNNPARVIRAIEAMRITGKTFSSLRKSTPKTRDFTVLRFQINIPRELLYDRINTRVDQMMEAGLLEEARSVHHLKQLTSLRTVGYQELFEYFEGKITLDSAIELIKQHTRNYAKRQLTWFRRHPNSHILNFGSSDEMLNQAIETIENVIDFRME